MKENNPTKALLASENGDWFVRSSYWGNYSRVLQRMGGKYDQAIEVSISPINPSIPSEWQDLKQLRIRVHSTPNDQKNFTHRVLVPVWHDIREQLGCPWIQYLLHEDLLSEIDWVLFKQQQRAWNIGGGIPFVLICKDPTKYPLLVDYWLEFLKDNPAYLRYMVRPVSCFEEIQRKTGAA